MVGYEAQTMRQKRRRLYLLNSKLCTHIKSGQYGRCLGRNITLLITFHFPATPVHQLQVVFEIERNTRIVITLIRKGSQETCRFPERSSQSLFTNATPGGLVPPPNRRHRGAYPHRWCSMAPWLPATSPSWHTDNYTELLHQPSEKLRKSVTQ